MEKLQSFDSFSAIELQADLVILNKQNIKINFAWADPENKFLFPINQEGGRFHELWKQSCFEVFFRVKNKKKYYEINLSTSKAWNIYEFQSYREPQPPVEFQHVKKIEIEIEIGSTLRQLTADVVLDQLDLSQIEISFCAVLQLKGGRSTYWSTKHADLKPNFHHTDSFTIERKIL
ncbi:MAG: hypothetical protein AABY53_05525 [Bdellovibrionota bacterium]